MQKCELITDKSMIFTIVSQMWHFFAILSQKTIFEPKLPIFG